MNTKPTNADPFGYDENGLAIAVRLTSTTFAFGHEFCRALRDLIAHGCRPITRLLPDGTGKVFVFHPPSRRAELWVGPWKEDEPGVYSVINPVRKGLLTKSFFDYDTLRAFAERDVSDVAVVHAALPIGDSV